MSLFLPNPTSHPLSTLAGAIPGGENLLAPSIPSHSLHPGQYSNVTGVRSLLLTATRRRWRKSREDAPSVTFSQAILVKRVDTRSNGPLVPFYATGTSCTCLLGTAIAC